MSEIIPKSSLRKWAIKKYCEHCSTMELMATAENNLEKTAIAIVALLEVDPSTRYQGMCAEDVAYLKSCHQYLKPLVNDPGAVRACSSR
ncbi:MAG: hypothetical protein K9K86_06415 [Pseudomonadales bacterium]|nr:hypothetical protein [Pseudomonadales bacterium]